MSYRISFAAADVDWQIQMLTIYPEIANKHFYPGMNKAADALMAVIEPNIPEDTGLLHSRFRKAVSGKGLFITASVGFPNMAGVAYAVPLEYGARPHEIGYVPNLGVSFLVHEHPGIKARKFMARGFLQAQSAINTEMENGARGVVDELAKGES